MRTWFKRTRDLFAAKPASTAAGRHGRVPVPGEVTLELPAGVVRVYYEVDEGGSGAFVHAPAGLEVRVRDHTGAELPLTPKNRFSQSVYRGPDGSGRSYVGQVEVGRAGPHVVSAELEGATPVPARLCLGD